MKTIYNAILERLTPQLHDNTLRWFDWDKSQLKKKTDMGVYPVAYPCALIRIGVTGTEDVTDKIQDCKTAITITLAFDPNSYGQTAGNTPERIREQGLSPYDVIAIVYARLQGFGTDDFGALTRRTQGEMTHNDLFVYQIVFNCEFEDRTAEE